MGHLHSHATTTSNKAACLYNQGFIYAKVKSTAFTDIRVADSLLDKLIQYLLILSHQLIGQRTMLKVERLPGDSDYSLVDSGNDGSLLFE